MTLALGRVGAIYKDSFWEDFKYGCRMTASNLPTCVFFAAVLT